MRLTGSYIGFIILTGLITIFTAADLYSDDNRLIFRISVENTESHVQTRAVQAFSDQIAEALQDRLDVRFYHSASLFRDSEVVRAITRGDLEMAVPGTWQLDKYVPEISYLLMPDFYGADSDDIDVFFENPGGRELNRRIEYSLDVKIPGLWMNLGPAHIFTTNKQITDVKDFRNLRIRVAGGIANKKRVEIFGAEGIIIPWPDLPQRIKDKSIDGLLTTFESIRSAELWDLGIRYAYADNEYFAQYVPIISGYFWNLLTADEKAVFTEIWNKTALQQRRDAEEAQKEAMRLAEKHGIMIYFPAEEQMNEAKRLLEIRSGEISSMLNIDNEFLDFTREIK